MIQAEPKISIITASYNYADLIVETIESVIAQSYTNWELIIVDDGSKDKSLEVINAYAQKDYRIKVFCHENHENKGLPKTISLGLEKASSEWVAFLESDDAWDKNYLETKVSVTNEHPDCGLIFNDVELFGDNQAAKRLDEYFEFQKFFLKKRTYPSNVFKYMLFINLIPTFSTVVVKKSLLSGLDFNPPFQPHLDWYLWLQITYKTSVFYLNQPLTKWRIHPNSFIGRTQSIKKNNNKVLYKTVKAIFKDNNIVDFFKMVFYFSIMLFFKMSKSSIKMILRKIISNYA